MTEENQTPHTRPGDDDTQGHRMARSDDAADADDTQGHRMARSDDAAEDDAQGHGFHPI